MASEIRHKSYLNLHSFSSRIKLGVRKFGKFFDIDLQDSLKVKSILLIQLYLLELG